MIDFLARLRGKLFILTCRALGRKVSCGEGLKIYKRLSIEGAGAVQIGRNCSVHGIRGDRNQFVTIDTHSTDAKVTIGDNAKLYAARVSAKFEITIGNDVLIEESGVADTDFHSIDKGRGTPDESKERCRVVIGHRVRIGSRSFIMKGVTIDDDVIIVPGSIVVKSVKSKAIICGNPAKPFNA